MQRVVKVLMACAIMAMPLRLGDVKAAPGATSKQEYALAEQALRGGRVNDALGVLENAARQNVLAAQLRLGRIYADGSIAAKDDVKACKLFESAVEGHSAYDRMHADAPLMGEALRSLGLCYLKGLSAPGLERDTTRAAELFLQAGAIYEDRVGLFELAKLYLKGDGVRQNPRIAVSYLHTAARKRYAPALAMLGTMKWEGKMMKRQGTAGLALLMLAREGAASEDRGWIERAFEDAKLTASKEEEFESATLAKNWKGAYGASEAPSLEATNSVPTDSPVINARADDGVPLPVRAPWHQASGGVEENQFSAQPTGADVPAAASPVQP